MFIFAGVAAADPAHDDGRYTMMRDLSSFSYLFLWPLIFVFIVFLWPLFLLIIPSSNLCCLHFQMFLPCFSLFLQMNECTYLVCSYIWSIKSSLSCCPEHPISSVLFNWTKSLDWHNTNNDKCICKA